MLQGNINNIGDLVIVLKEHNDNDVLQCITLQNKTEFNFMDVRDISINHQNILIVNLNIGGYDLSLTVDISLFKNRNI